ncbi:MAG: 6-phosphofructokinase [Bacteroidetes bacterium]|nr:MAG: 6-phosphofructokinase [Bacteroidota bacterium]
MKKVAVYTSGGDAPGMNACIRAVVRGAIYHGAEIFGIRYGYNGMIKGDIKQLNSYSVSNIIQKGGTILKSARSEDFKTKEGRKKAFDFLREFGIEGLICIGGDGSFTGAKIFYEEFGVAIVGAPGTIDNDIYGTDFTIGFDTAVNTAIQAIDKIRDTADSHDRIFFVEVMGRDSGYIAIRCGICGGAEMVLVPETSTTIEDVIETLRAGKSRSKTSSIIVVAEGDEIGGAIEIAKRARESLVDTDIRVATLGHIQRGGAPSAKDRILASRMGLSAIEGLLNGRKNVMAGVMKDELVYTPFEHAITIKKTLSPDLLRMMDIFNA